MAQPAQRPGQSKQNYATPLEFIAAVKRRWNLERFAHDFAADSTNTKAPTFFDERRNALLVPRWERVIGGGGVGWLNPPFADIGPWAYRCHETATNGGNIMLLVPAGVGANWYRDFVHRKALVLALNGRLPFMADKPEWLYPKDCILCCYGPDVQPDFDVWDWRSESKPVYEGLL
jgi:hypothetical protein